jgi:hypothetical protein
LRARAAACTLAAGLGVAFWPGTTWADGEADACAKAYESAQEHRTEGHLRAAAEQLLACAQTTCPGFIRSDCTRWLEEVQAAQPSVVFAARRDGKDVDEVAVSCDGQQLVPRLDGRAVPLDPGKHSCRLEAAGAQPVILDLLIVEGQKNRVVSADLQTAAAAAAVVAPAPAVALASGSGGGEKPSPGARRYGPLALAGVGALGVVGFAAFGWSGLSAERRLEDECAPACSASQVSSVRTKYRLADVSLLVGLVAGSIGGYYLLGGHDDREPGVALNVGPGTATVGVRSSF